MNSKEIEIKTGKNKRGTRRICSRMQLAQRKALITSKNEITREFTTCHPSSYPLI